MFHSFSSYKQLLSVMADAVHRRRAVAIVAIKARYDEVHQEGALAAMVGPGIWARQQQLIREFKHFRKLHDELVLELDNDDLPGAGEVYEEVSQQYFSTIALLKEEYEKHKGPNMNESAASSRADDEKLQVEMAQKPDPGEFDGRSESWPVFRDNFIAEVHSRQRLNNVTKLKLLQKACVGAAQSILGKWRQTEANYERAWAELKKKYDDNFVLKQAFVTEILSIKPLQRETKEGLRPIIDTMTSALRQLEAFEVDVGAADVFLIGVVLGALPPYTYNAWEEKREIDPEPTLQDVLQFLERRTRHHPRMNKPTVPSTASTVTTDSATNPSTSGNNNLVSPGRSRDNRRGGAHRVPSNNPRREFKDDPSNRKPEQATDGGNGKTVGVEQRPLCPLCKRPHALYRCAEFLDKTVKQREAKVAELQLCFNCLRSHIGPCRFGDCRRCPGKMHNSAICPEQDSVPKGAANSARPERQGRPQTKPYNRPY